MSSVTETMNTTMNWETNSTQNVTENVTSYSWITTTQLLEEARSTTDSEIEWQHLPDYVKVLRYILVGVFPVIGLVGNILVLAALSTRKLGTSGTNLLIGNLAFADLVFSLQSLVFAVPSLSAERWLFGDLGCKIRSYILGVLISCTLSTMFLICLVRFYKIRHYTSSCKFFTVSQVKWIIATNWILCLTASIPILILDDLWGYHWKDDCNLVLFEFPSPAAPYSVFAIGLFFLLPTILMPYFYSRIFCLTCHHRRRISTRVNENNSGISNNQSSQLKLTIMLCIVYTFFVVVYLPYVALFFINMTNVEVSRESFGMAANFLSLQAMANPFIYASMSREFLAGFKIIMCCQCHSCLEKA